MNWNIKLQVFNTADKMTAALNFIYICIVNFFSWSLIGLKKWLSPEKRRVWSQHDATKNISCDLQRHDGKWYSCTCSAGLLTFFWCICRMSHRGLCKLLTGNVFRPKEKVNFGNDLQRCNWKSRLWKKKRLLATDKTSCLEPIMENILVLFGVMWDSYDCDSYVQC